MGEVLARHIADPLAHKAEPDVREGAAGEVDDRAGERFIERREGGAEASDAAPFPEPGIQRRPQNESTVFHRVVVVDLEIARAGKLEVEVRMAGEGHEHMVEEAETGGDFALAGPIELEDHRDRGFLRPPFEARSALPLFAHAFPPRLP